MRGFLMMCVCLSLAGCFAAASQGRSTTEYVNDDGIHPVQRTSVTQSYEGSSVGGTMPAMMGGGYGYGGGYRSVNGASCVLHPDNCAVIQTATVVQPVNVVSNGGGGMVGPGGAGTYGEPRDTAELEARIERLESAIPKLAGGTILSLRQSCYVILKDPGAIADAAEREKIVAGCTKLLNANPNEEK